MTYLSPSLERLIFTYLRCEECAILKKFIPGKDFSYEGERRTNDENEYGAMTTQRMANFAASTGWIDVLRRVLTSIDLNTAFRAAARQGQITAMVLLKSWGASQTDTDIAGAASGGHIEAMNLLLMWGGQDLENALAVAAENGQLSAFLLIKSWKPKWPSRAILQVISGAAQYGHLHILSAIEKRAWMYPDHILKCSACGNQVEIMKIAKERGARDADGALIAAAETGACQAIELAISWGADAFTSALRLAVSNGQIEAMLTIKRAAAKLDPRLWLTRDDLNDILEGAATNGEVEPMKLLKEWGADDFDQAFLWATVEVFDCGRGLNHESITLLVSWGLNRGFVENVLRDIEEDFSISEADKAFLHKTFAL